MSLFVFCVANFGNFRTDLNCMSFELERHADLYHKLQQVGAKKGPIQCSKFSQF